MINQYKTPAFRESFSMFNEKGLHCVIPHYMISGRVKNKYTFGEGEEERYNENKVKVLNRSSAEKIADQMSQWHEEAIKMNRKFKYMYVNVGY